MTNNRNVFVALLLAASCACNDRTHTDDGMCFYEDPQLGLLRWCNDERPQNGPPGAAFNVASATLPHSGDGPCDPCPTAPELDELLIERGKQFVNTLGPSAQIPCPYERIQVLRVDRECHASQPVDNRCGYGAHIWYVCDDE